MPVRQPYMEILKVNSCRIEEISEITFPAIHVRNLVVKSPEFVFDSISGFHVYILYFIVEQ